MIVLILTVLVITLGILFNLIFCMVFEKLDAKKFQRENAIQLACGFVVGCDGGGGYNDGKSIEQKSGLKSAIYDFLSHYGYGLMRLSVLVTSRIPSNRIRNFMYRHVFRAKITKKTVINGGVEIRSPWNLRADRCVVMSGCILDARHGITIGEDVVFGTGVHIWTEEHDLNDPNFAVTPDHAKPVIIGERAWICSDSTILPGTVIGDGSVVAARACVIEDCAPFGVYGGVPAKIISSRNQELSYRLSGKPHWHFY